MLLTVFLVGALATAAQAGSCSGRCGSGVDHNQPCQCNSHCVTYGDCCSDYQTVCLATCLDRCNSPVDSSRPCQCNTACTNYGDCCDDYNVLCQGGTGSGATLSDVMTDLWNLDTNRVAGSDYNVSYQTPVSSGNNVDRASEDFFSYLNTNVLNRLTYSRMIDLLDNYNPRIGEKETLTPQQWEEVEDFLDAILDTDVMQRAYNFLKDEGKTINATNFRGILKELWFNLYPRSALGATDSSGFEHVIVGEQRDSVSGFHNWVQFYLEEKASRINYLGYVKSGDPEIVGAQFLWNGLKKSMGSFFVAVSPEFDIAVYTICALMHSNSVCSFTMNGWSVKIQTWDVSHKLGLQIASAYPIL